MTCFGISLSFRFSVCSFDCRFSRSENCLMLKSIECHTKQRDETDKEGYIENTQVNHGWLSQVWIRLKLLKVLISKRWNLIVEFECSLLTIKFRNALIIRIYVCEEQREACWMANKFIRFLVALLPSRCGEMMMWGCVNIKDVFFGWIHGVRKFSMHKSGEKFQLKSVFSLSEALKGVIHQMKITQSRRKSVQQLIGIVCAYARWISYE